MVNVSLYTERIIKQLFSAVCIYRKYQDSLYYEHIIYMYVCMYIMNV